MYNDQWQKGLSLKGLISAVMNKLTDHMIGEEKGIEDYYERICLPTNILEPLGWIADAVTEYDI